MENGVHTDLKTGKKGIDSMDSFQTPFWELPIAFAMNESARNRIGEMTDEEREVLRQKSSLAGSEEELEELVRMVAEGKFE